MGAKTASFVYALVDLYGQKIFAVIGQNKYLSGFSFRIISKSHILPSRASEVL